MEAINASGRGRPGYPHSSRPTTAERLAHEAPLAVGVVLFRAHERARSLEAQLELEAADPRVDELFQSAKRLRKGIAVLLVEVAFDEAEKGVATA